MFNWLKKQPPQERIEPVAHSFFDSETRQMPPSYADTIAHIAAQHRKLHGEGAMDDVSGANPAKMLLGMPTTISDQLGNWFASQSS